MAVENKIYTAYDRFHGWKRSILQNPDQERTNQKAPIDLKAALPYNNRFYFLVLDSPFQQPRSVSSFSCRRINF